MFKQWKKKIQGIRHFSDDGKSLTSWLNETP